ncbi:MAG: molybdopterin-dependent oxidoreductase, partial [Negativicutes bacterium]|nr:molybdopterin-dependent oxidoreductase [Negativicutes bacterium]
FETCSIVSTQDTDVSPYDTGAYASRQTYVTGMAVRKAAEEIRAKDIEYASGMIDKPEFTLDIRDGWLVYRENGARIMKVSEVTYDAYCDLRFGRPITADVGHNARVNALAFGCTFVELEVDIPLAQVTIKEIFNVHDSGRIINPVLAAGQVHGGMSMALGYAMYEVLQFDEKTGKPLNPTLLDYKLMTTLDTPDLGCEFVETNPEPNAPYGNRALGEPPTCSPAPAIRNAILDATGVAFYELPINPHKMMARFQELGLI